MTGCLTRFFSPPSRFIFSFRSFGIVSHLHKLELEDREEEFRPREGSRGSIRHANVS